MEVYHRLFSFLTDLLTAAAILTPILLYYFHKRNVLRTKREILLKEIEKGSIVDPVMLAKSLTNLISEEQRLQNNLRSGIIFSFAGVAIAIAAAVFYSYMQSQFSGTSGGTDQMIPVTLVVTLIMIVAAILLGVGIAYLVSYFNQKKRINKTA